MKDRRMIGQLFAVIIFDYLCLFSEAYTINDELSLHTAIFNSTYDRDVRPGASRSTPLQIMVTFIFKSIKELDESVGKFSITGALGVFWVDHRLSWNPTDYGGDLNTTVVPQKKIWIPFLVNTMDFDTLKPIGHNELNLRVANDGKVTWITPNMFESTCDADMSFYPFDSQICTLRFYIQGFTLSEIVFAIPKSSMDMNEYSENGIWEVKETQIYIAINSQQIQEVRMTISMKRRPVYYISSLILPVIFLAFLQLFVFVMPPECGERVGFVTTVLLAIAVYLTLVQDKLPEGSEPSVSFLSYKLLGDFMIGVFMTISVIVGLRFYHREEETVIPDYLETFHRMLFRCCRCKRKHKVNFDEKKSATEVTIDSVSKILTWRDIGMAIDRFCLILFGIILVISNGVYLAVMCFYT
ncbi:neuronal acetylcholine receptor subunit alpha-6-like [Saccostrea echinata]|uniref:neuronal acetylcholine receptor subunit alpha-6-like n=1 Tax=Saccostrea echinata TaxID=191078 RepID=UPI002A804976|nr:neuronal acetylcholine receptor subunit alpha-6-like [Saccostrea echinata]